MLVISGAALLGTSPGSTNHNGPCNSIFHCRVMIILPVKSSWEFKQSVPPCLLALSLLDSLVFRPTDKLVEIGRYCKRYSQLLKEQDWPSGSFPKHCSCKFVETVAQRTKFLDQLHHIYVMVVSPEHSIGKTCILFPGVQLIPLTLQSECPAFGLTRCCCTCPTCWFIELLNLLCFQSTTALAVSSYLGSVVEVWECVLNGTLLLSQSLCCHDWHDLIAHLQTVMQLAGPGLPYPAPSG